MTLTKEQAMFTSDTAKYKIIGICTSCVQSDYVREIVSSISRKGVKEGYKVLLFNTFATFITTAPTTMVKQAFLIL